MTPSTAPEKTLPSLFGQASSLAVAVSLERLVWKQADLLVRASIYADRSRKAEYAVVNDLLALTVNRLAWLIRPAVVVTFRPYARPRFYRRDPVARQRILAVRGWRRKYPKLLRKD